MSNYDLKNFISEYVDGEMSTAALLWGLANWNYEPRLRTYSVSNFDHRYVLGSFDDVDHAFETGEIAITHYGTLANMMEENDNGTY